MKMPFDDNSNSKFDMAPMIDMVFLLLIFFMLVSTISASQNKEMTLATSTEANIPDDRPDRLIINVDIDGNIYIGGSDEIVTIETVESEIRSRAKENPRLKVSLRCDAESEAKMSRGVIEACGRAGVDNIVFAASKEEK